MNIKATVIISVLLCGASTHGAAAGIKLPPHCEEIFTEDIAADISVCNSENGNTPEDNEACLYIFVNVFDDAFKCACEVNNIIGDLDEPLNCASMDEGHITQEFLRFFEAFAVMEETCLGLINGNPNLLECPAAINAVSEEYFAVLCQFEQYFTPWDWDTHEHCKDDIPITISP